ncbi:hypothetical protein BDV93DRAFT_500313 [Ceratobasidium sp. AG-I]|nr:hypothetical protein BDV93DRAFT_500313 [Ceratobasidium sp. AG-I]
MNRYLSRRFSTTPTPPPVSSRTRPYVLALQRLSARTGTPLPSLIVSFAILHEITSVVPLVSVFFGARALGAGDALVTIPYPNGQLEENQTGGWVIQTCRGWVDEGEAWAGRIGRRYGLFGYQKRDKSDIAREESDVKPMRLAGDVANAVLAYGVVKAVMPLRIGLSLWLSPAFSRRCVDPIRMGIAKLWPRAKGRK